MFTVYIHSRSDIYIYIYMGPVNKSVFGKILSEIEKAVKIFLIPNKTFSKNDILLCALMAHISRILYECVYIYMSMSLSGNGHF